MSADAATLSRAPTHPPARVSCAYCGLPVVTKDREDQPHYCCFGCRFAASIAEADGETGQSRWLMMRLGIAVFCSMNVMVFTFFLWSQEGVVASGAAAVLYDVARYICLLFTLPVLLLLGGPLAEDAAAELGQGRPSLNLLLVIGSGAAFLYSLVSVLTNQGHVYFEVPCMVLVAVMLGRWLEATGKLKTTEALRALEQMLPATVRRTTGSSNNGALEEAVPLAAVEVGDWLRILPGERIPVDGRICRGRAAIDEQLLTGESIPCEKGPGDLLHSGTLNLDGELILAATARASGSAVQQMIDAVTDAISGKGRFQRLAEQVAAWFLPLIIVVAAAAFGVHWYARGLGPALLAGLAVVVIACPCALGLATPMALWAAVGKAIRHQVLIRDGDALARLANARTVAFDKTGTLTAASEVAAFDSFDPRAARVAVALAEANRHPLSQAIARWGDENAIRPAPIDEVRVLPGRGVQAFVPALGSLAWLGSASLDSNLGADPSSGQAGEVVIGWQGEVRGRFQFREQLRAQARSVIAALHAAHLKPLLLSGDQSPRVAQVARDLAIEWQGSLLPQEKLSRVQELRKSGAVVMVGDGLNDAPALAAADVGIALGCGADVSRWTASVCLLNDDLTRLPWLFELARRTVRTIRWNLVWAFGYNALGIPLAAAGWLHPAVAAGAMALSSVLVVANSLQLAAEEQPHDAA